MRNLLIRILKIKPIYYWDRKNKSQDETINKPDGIPGFNKWEINVSKNGRHVFATDGTIRNYSDSQIRDLILLFREKFPSSEGYFINATNYRIRASIPIVDFVQAALDGEYKLGVG